MNACEKTCVYVWRGNRNLPSAGFGFSGWLKATPVAATDGDGLGTVSGRARDGLGLGSRRDHWHGRAHFRKVQISWQAQHFGKVGYRFRGRCITFARSSADFVTGAAFSYFWHGRIANPIGTDAQGGACRFRGRGSIFARSGTDFVAGASSQGQVHISWQGQHFRRVTRIFRGRRSTFTRSCTYFVAGAALSQGQVQNSWQAQHFCKVNFRSRGSKIATFKCQSSKRSQLSQLGLENRNF